MLLSKYSNNDTHCVWGILQRELLQFLGVLFTAWFLVALAFFPLFFGKKQQCLLYLLVAIQTRRSLQSPLSEMNYKNMQVHSFVTKWHCQIIMLRNTSFAFIFLSCIYISSKTYVLLESDAMQFFINILPSQWSTFPFLCTLLQIGGFSFIYARFSLISLLTEKRCLLRVVCLNLVENFAGLLFT